MTVRYVRPADVAWVEGSANDRWVATRYELYLAKIPDGPLIRLAGSTASIWWEALDHESGDLVERVATWHGADPDSIRADVNACSVTCSPTASWRSPQQNQHGSKVSLPREIQRMGLEAQAFGARTRPSQMRVVSARSAVRASRSDRLSSSPLSAPLPASVLDDDVPVPRTDLLQTILGEGLILCDPRHPEPVVLSNSAGLIWQMVDGHRSVVETTDLLAAQLDLPPGGSRRRHSVHDPGLQDIGLLTPTLDRVGPRPPLRMPRPWPARIEALLDRVPWDTQIGPVAVAGAVATVRTNDPEIGFSLADALAPFPSAHAPEVNKVTVLNRGHACSRRFVIYVDGKRRWGQSDHVGLLGAVISELNEIAASRSRGHAVFHAGAVERDGRVIMIAGRSGFGKSTLTGRAPGSRLPLPD